MAVTFKILLQTWLKSNSSHVKQLFYLEYYKLYVGQRQYPLTPDELEVKIVTRFITLVLLWR